MIGVTQLSLRTDELESTVGPRLDQQVFHFTSGASYLGILQRGRIIQNSDGRFKTTSRHSFQSMAHHLKAIALFDLRSKSSDQITLGKSFYNYLCGQPGQKIVYLIISPRVYSRLITLRDLEEDLRLTKMYLPEIESWYEGDLFLEDIKETILVDIT